MTYNLDRINYLINKKNAIILKELDEIQEIMIPQTMFSKGAYQSNIIQAYYISDIHLEQHLENNNINIGDRKSIVSYFDAVIKKMISNETAFDIMGAGLIGGSIKDLANSCFGRGYLRFLYRNLNDEKFEELIGQIYNDEFDAYVEPVIRRFVVFDGDISANIGLVKLFFDRMLLRFKYCLYKSWKKSHGCIADVKNGLTLDAAIQKYNKKLELLKISSEKKRKTLKRLEEKLGKTFVKYYYKKDSYDIKRLILERKDIPDYVAYILLSLKRLEGNVDYYVENKQEMIERYQASSYEVFDGNIKSICPIFYILGNHEYSSFTTIDEAVKAYRAELHNYPITILQNDINIYGNCVVLGGSGFAQYNDKYNADSLLCAHKMMGNRAYEINEGKIFEEKYNEALTMAREKNIPLVVLTHYPTKDWLLGQTDRQCYYFTGHTHNNTVNIGEQGTIYADNQIGYDSESISLRKYPIGTMLNPFIDYEDGIHQITPQQYLDFYLYNGESPGIGLIERSVKKNNPFYMIKRNGFYGFFIVTKKNIQICVGGRPKNITTITDINYIYNCFMIMVYQYVMALKPYRKFQEKISEEIKKLSIPSSNIGRIHGCIVDIDFTHHIMINPSGSGKITFYYSPFFGLVQEYENIERLLESVEQKSPWLLDAKCLYRDSKRRFLEDKNNILLSLSSSNYIGELKDELVSIDIAESIYPASAKLNQLQRLFTANILRDWDQSIIGNLIEIEDIDSYALEEKLNKLNPYQKVQKHWKNLLLIETENISIKLVRCALDKKRKCIFPYKVLEKHHGYEIPNQPMDDDELKNYIRHIPEDILVETFRDFEYYLGIDILKYYPLDIIPVVEVKRVFEQYSLGGKDLIDILEYIGDSKWPIIFGNLVVDAFKGKKRPSNCPDDLWEKIKNY
ncbi:Calcineurin-like phosphoesterase [Pseudobutyrivibrio sp. AR14]|uniref:metallophosphoesterase n=1 Tax=Pseudobutyrivibrio sp. AR14 TaxID=1520804 RepID=UPI00087EA154|nr:metallophosphoesterase [Pseudobutyrivibrio sp. AR14]SCY32409.1 Calcineurin-like phosphoesterase [Pseudobutyrivibrio sp. AR14]